MAPNYTPGPDGPDRERPDDDVSQRKNHLMNLADQVDRADGGSSFPRILRSPLGALVVFLLVVAVVVWLGFPNYL